MSKKLPSPFSLSFLDDPAGCGGRGADESRPYFAHEGPDLPVRGTQTGDYYGLTVKGTLIADGEDSTTAILFTPLDKLLYPTGFTSGAAEWARKPGDWRGIEVEARGV